MDGTQANKKTMDDWINNVKKDRFGKSPYSRAVWWAPIHCSQKKFLYVENFITLILTLSNEL